jgi:hypothetical protein
MKRSKNRLLILGNFVLFLSGCLSEPGKMSTGTSLGSSQSGSTAIVCNSLEDDVFNPSDLTKQCCDPKGNIPFLKYLPKVHDSLDSQNYELCKTCDPDNCQVFEPIVEEIRKLEIQSLAMILVARSMAVGKTTSMVPEPVATETSSTETSSPVFPTPQQTEAPTQSVTPTDTQPVTPSVTQPVTPLPTTTDTSKNALTPTIDLNPDFTKTQ